MDNIMNFLQEYYMIVAVVVGILFLALIGYVAEKAKEKEAAKKGEQDINTGDIKEEMVAPAVIMEETKMDTPEMEPVALAAEENEEVEINDEPVIGLLEENEDENAIPMINDLELPAISEMENSVEDPELEMTPVEPIEEETDLVMDNVVEETNPIVEPDFSAINNDEDLFAPLGDATFDPNAVNNPIEEVTETPIEEEEKPANVGDLNSMPIDDIFSSANDEDNFL